jgi:hypothetical protein
MSENNFTVHYVRIPKDLKKNEILEAVGIGIYQIFSGCRPLKKYKTKKTKTRIKISSKAEEYLNTLINSNEFKSKNEILILALAYVAEQPEWVRAATF